MTAIPKTAPVEKVTAKHLLARLRRHYIKPGSMPGGIFVPECGLNNGVGAQKRVDAVHVGFTTTSGRILTGHEIKVSRGDWLHELDQPGKADMWADQCHAWYLVTPRDLVRAEEVPDGWGLMVPSSRTTTRMDVVIKARTRTYDVGQHDPSWLIVRSIMARLDTLQAGELQRVRREAQDDAREQIEKVSRELAHRSTTMTDGTAERVARIIRLANEQARQADVWHTLTDEEIVTALADVAAARDLAQRMRYRLGEMARAAETLAEPWKHAGEKLCQLIGDSADMDGAR